ncbi:MAG: phage holin family protein [Micrococcales bacterium]|nr:phage holin family protein [Micrococcales bacterium]
MVNLAIRVGVNALALWLTALVVPGIRLGEESPSLSNRLVTILLVAVVFGIVNAAMKPVVTFFSLPFIVLTLGLFTIVVNAAMLAITAWVSGGLGLDFSIDSFFWSAILGALVLSFISMLLSTFVPDPARPRA